MKRNLAIGSVLALGIAAAAAGALRQSTPAPAPEADPGRAVLARADQVSRLEQEYDRLNDLCRGGPDDGSTAAKATLQACDAREQTTDALKHLGYCYTPVAAGYDWQTCPA